MEKKLGEDPSRPVRIFCDGVYDCFHYGHARQLEQAKKLFKHVYLIVGVNGDEDVKRYKGLSVMTENERAECVRHCKWVDEVIVNSPWVYGVDWLDKHKIDFVAHDDIPYVSAGIDDLYGPFKKAGRFVATQRTEGISTTDLIVRIVRDREGYIIRNLQRGVSRSDLQVSWLFGQYLSVRDKLRKWICPSRQQSKKKAE
eukprot:TRINITY_DN7769_c0_g3_i12.p1 TRINITY_DN7769_c0_g3~~TRINITY_DN7769_c0_g3_i12.p1  ORF type:complete len:199 (-),score=26.78 TRINITY_DN7769_c0_g3_i12:97-693(-)